MKNIITGLLSKAYKLDDGKISELLDGENVNESEVIAEILKLDKARVDEIKKNVDSSGKFQEGYAKAKKEERAKFEEEIKGLFAIDSDKTGTDLIEEIIEAKATGKPAELTETDIKKSDVYRKMENSYKKTLSDKEAEFNAQLETLNKNHTKEKTFASIKERATDILTGLNPIFPKAPKVANNIRNQFLNELNGFDYEIADDGSVIVLKEGQVLDDGHGHSKSFDDIVREVSSNYFEFSGNNGGENAGNRNDGGNGGGGSGTIPRFKNEDELFTYSNNPDIPLEDRLKAVEQFNKENV